MVAGFYQPVELLLKCKIALGFVLAAISGDDENTSSGTTNSEVTTVEAEPPVIVDARTLVVDYESNEVAADKMYKGKMLEVSGTVAGIDSDFSDGAIVKLIGKNEFQVAQAQGDDGFTDYASTLKKGENVVLICKSDGEVIGFPQLSKCQPK